MLDVPAHVLKRDVDPDMVMDSDDEAEGSGKKLRKLGGRKGGRAKRRKLIHDPREPDKAIQDVQDPESSAEASGLCKGCGFCSFGECRRGPESSVK